MTGAFDVIADIAMSAPTKEEFWRVLKTAAPGQTLKIYNNAAAYARDHYKPRREPWVARFTEFNNVPPELLEWNANRANDDEDRPKALVIRSPTRFGKTAWARGLDPHHFYCGTTFNLDKLQKEKEDDPEPELLIFDDVPLETLADNHKYKFFFGAQAEADLTHKYRQKVTVRRTWKHFVFLTNEDPYAAKGINTEWLVGNMTYVHLVHPLFMPEDHPDRGIHQWGSP